MSDIFLYEDIQRATDQNPAVSPADSDTAIYMLGQLDASRLTVSLAPSLPGYNGASRQIRVTTSKNPAWYQEFCAQHAPSARRKRRKRRKPDTYIKRQHTLRALAELADGRCQSDYAHRLLPFVRAETRRIQQSIQAGRTF